MTQTPSFRRSRDLDKSNKFRQMPELTNVYYSEIKIHNIFHIAYKAIEFSTNKNNKQLHSRSPILGVRWPSGLGLQPATGRSMVRLPLRATLRFGTLAIPLTLLCQCLSDETLKAVGPFYLVSMPGEVKDPTSPHWNV